MKRTSSEGKSLSNQMKKKSKKDTKEQPEYAGNDELMISTGSTLLDLAISGGRKRGGGIPTGIFVEIFGPSSAGKTVLLCEMAGEVQRKGGNVKFGDPEARLNSKFAEIFDLDTDKIDYYRPNTVPEIFKPVRDWKIDNDEKVNGAFADSLTALSTDMEMEGKDKYGARRAKEFSEQLRQTCRVIAKKNILLIGTNQLRANMNSGPFGRKWTVPGGKALEYYASLRLHLKYATKIKEKKTIRGKKTEQVVGVKTTINVHKSSIWKPHQSADITILFDYGIDDIKGNLQFIKDYSSENVYTLDGAKLHNHSSKAIRMVEKEGKKAVKKLKTETIDLWEEIQEKFESQRRPKLR
jgi:recombination protein RecA